MDLILVLTNISFLVGNGEIEASHEQSLSRALDCWQIGRDIFVALQSYKRGRF